MHYILTRLPKSEVEINVTLPFDEFEPHVTRAAELISQEIDIKGFRRGKAPFATVQQAVGEAAVLERAAQVAVRATYPKTVLALEESGELPKDRPLIGRPEVSVTKLARGNEFAYTARATLFPELTLPDYHAIAREAVAREKKDITITDEETSRALDWLRESRQKLVTVSRPAAMNDAVEVDFTIRSGGVKIEQGESRNHPFVLGRGRFLPGYEESLVGMSAGEENTITLMAPDDWPDPRFRRKPLEITTHMKLVQKREIPELDDAFAASLGNFATVAALTESVQDGIKREKEEAEQRRVRTAITEAVLMQTAVELPDVLIHAELDRMTAEFRANIERFGATWDEHLARLGKKPDELRTDWRNDAEKRAKTSLILREIARRERVKPAAEDVAKFVERARTELASSGEDARRINEARLREYAIGVLEREKVFALLEGSADPRETGFSPR